jgi:outer membrane immunogenic protein
MKNLATLGSIALTMIVSAPALAADLRGPVTKGPIAAPAPVYNWTGWYVGGNVGYGWGEKTDPTLSFSDSTGTFPFIAAAGRLLFESPRPSGVIGGGQIGFNWQNGPWVWGLVADFQGSGMDDTKTVIVPPAGPTFATTDTLSAKVDWFGTARARIGYANQNWLLYATGGLAYGKVKSTLSFNFPASGFAVFGAHDSTNFGWTAGAGIDYGISNQWTVGVEYLYVDLGSDTVTATPTAAALSLFPAAAATSLSARQDFTFHILRGTINYRF